MREGTIGKRYDYKRVEEYWTKRWQDSGIYTFDKGDRERPIFSIDNPPSFSSGSLHMGHVLNHCWIDITARYRRMRGYNVFFPIGYDCHGLPTELRVEYDLGIPREDRDRFVKGCIKLTRENIARMDEQYRAIGYSADWNLYYETMSEEYVQKVQLSLLKFFERGLIYRATFPVHWCTHCSTALAKSELGYLTKPGKLYYINLSTTLGRDITIATTRPEMMGACVAVFVHPDDERYREYIGKEAVLPIYERRVPILSDKDVDVNFGTGVVYLCTYGDENDVRWQRKYGLPSVLIMNKDGTLNEKAGAYGGLSIEEARERIIVDLRSARRLVRVEDITHEVLSHTERSSCLTPIEFLPVPQWFIKIRPFLGEVAEEGRQIKWYPDFMLGRLVDWAESLDWDWIISRQRIFGTPIPFWYCESCNEIIPPRREELPVNPVVDKPPVTSCPKCGSKRILGAEDVCDCWVDSSITPLFITGWEKGEGFFGRVYPMTLRPQGYEIIRTWLFYTLFRCLLLTGKRPFKEALINGMVAGPDGRKMSKSFGNVIEPDEVLETHPADSLRQWAALATLGMDYPFSWKEVETGEKFLTKIWNASRFAAIHLAGFKPKVAGTLDLSPIDHWILSRLDRTIDETTKGLDGYRFNTFIRLRDFFWHEFCDHYIEAVKPRLYDPGKFPETSREAVRFVLYTVLLNSLKLLAPFLPFITEEIYHKVLGASDGESIHLLDWPKPLGMFDPEKARTGEVAKEVIAKARRAKSKIGIPLSAQITVLKVTVPSGDIAETVRMSGVEVTSTINAEKMDVVVGDVETISVSLTGRGRSKD